MLLNRLAINLNMQLAGSAKLQILQDAWTECAGEWRSSTLYKQMIERKRTSRHGARVWLTQGQIEQKYQSKEIAEEICRAKRDDPELYKTHTKPHEDCPNNEARHLPLGCAQSG